MNEIQLFSFRRTIIISLILGLFTMVIVGQAIDTRNPNDESGNDQLSSTTTTTSETSTTTSTSTQTETQTDTQLETVVQSTEIVGDFADPVANRDQTLTENDAIGLGSPSISDIGNSISRIFGFSLQFLMTSSLFFALLATFYIFIFNSTELKDYINQSLKQAGFHGKISSFGKRWVIKGKDGKFTMNIMGFRNLRMRIELPKDTDTDPREFGLRRLDNSALTYCDLEVLPMRLQVVKMYLTKIG